MDKVKLANPAYVNGGGVAASVYANPVGKKSFIKGLMLFNGHTSSEVVRIYMVPNNAAALGAAGVANQVGEVTITAKDTVYFSLAVDGFPIVLTDQNDAIFASTTTASKVVVVPVGDRE